MLTALLLSGCASVPMAKHEDDVAAKKFMPPDGKSNIYVYRNEYMGGAVAMEIDLDGKQVARTRAHNYVRLIVDPGNHQITSHAENDDTVEVDAVAGKNQFIWQEVKMGVMMARTKLHIVGEDEGMQGVKECQLVDFVKGE